MNDAPIAYPVTAASLHNSEVRVLLNAVDVDTGDSLTATVTSYPATGVLRECNGSPIPPSAVPFVVADATRVLCYTPKDGRRYVDTFQFFVSDGTDTSNSATATVVVGRSNIAPVVHNGTFTTLEDVPYFYSERSIPPSLLQGFFFLTLLCVCLRPCSAERHRSGQHGVDGDYHGHSDPRHPVPGLRQPTRFPGFRLMCLILSFGGAGARIGARRCHSVRRRDGPRSGVTRRAGMLLKMLRCAHWALSCRLAIQDHRVAYLPERDGSGPHFDTFAFKATDFVPVRVPPFSLEFLAGSHT